MEPRRLSILLDRGISILIGCVTARADRWPETEREYWIGLYTDSPFLFGVMLLAIACKHSPRYGNEEYWWRLGAEEVSRVMNWLRTVALEVDLLRQDLAYRQVVLGED